MAERGGRGLPSYNRTPASQRFSPLDQMSANLSVECVYLTLAALVVSAGIAVDWCDTVTIKTYEGLRSVAVTSSRNGLVIVHLGGVR